jgi:hypothetical protein
MTQEEEGLALEIGFKLASHDLKKIDGRFSPCLRRISTSDVSLRDMMCLCDEIHRSHQLCHAPFVIVTRSVYCLQDVFLRQWSRDHETDEPMYSCRTLAMLPGYRYKGRPNPQG